MLNRLTLVLLALGFGFSPGLAQERQWSLDASDREAFLVFGVPDTDDVGLSFWCEIGSNKVSLFMNGGPAQLKANQYAQINVGLDQQTLKVRAKAAIDKRSKLPSLEGQIGLNDKLLDAASRASSIKLTVDGRTNIYPLIEADFTGLRRICAGDAVN